ncbi:MAG: MBL fold metallo-hydrolase [Candidatus Riflebacteria bacterium]|nr:MBL fold metallo-hydrolase [Candidatus Riflebacteria bacterium]
MPDNFMLTLPDSRSPDFYRQLVEFGHFLEKESRAGCRYDLARWPNPLWQKIEVNMLAGLQRFLAADDRGITMLQWYNSGIFIKAAGKIIACDILPIPRYYNWPETPGLTMKIAEAIDALLITHDHKDHYDAELVNACQELGKPVYMHSGAVPADSSVRPMTNGCCCKLDQISFVAHHACHVWRKSETEVLLAVFEVKFGDNFRVVLCGDADYTKTLAGIKNQPDVLFITWRNPGPEFEDGHSEQTGTTLDAVQLAISRFAPRRLILEHYGELDHIYHGFSASYDMAVNLIESIDTPVTIHFWGDLVPLSSQE